MNVVADVDAVGFERLARPLLELVQRVTGLETSFVTQIDWASQRQEVVLALNTSALEVAEGSAVDWTDSMCRQALLSGRPQSSDAAVDLPGSIAAERLGMRSYFAVPVLAGDGVLGTVCGASRRSVEIDPEVMEIVRLVADSLAFQMSMLVEAQVQRERAERAEVEALADPLTELANRRGFLARVEEELARAGYERSPIAVLVIDIDRFKAVNDTFGHRGGDLVLRALGDVLRRTVRADDVPGRIGGTVAAGRAEDDADRCVPARLGGDEFAVLLPHADADGAEAVAARVATAFRRATGALGMPCTLSIGISTSELVPLRSLLEAADDALYASKASGRDRTELWTVGSGSASTAVGERVMSPGRHPVKTATASAPED